MARRKRPDRPKKTRPDRHATNPATGKVELVGADLADEWETRMGAAPPKPAPGTPEAKAKARRITYDREIADAILERLADGEGLRGICRNTEGYPSDSTVEGWVEKDTDGFAGRYAQARARGIEVLAEQCLEISDDAAGDVEIDGEGVVRTNHETVNRARLRVDTRKWLLSKLKPEKYGDAVAPPPRIEPDAADRRLARIAELLALATAKAAGVVVPATPEKPEEKL